MKNGSNHPQATDPVLAALVRARSIGLLPEGAGILVAVSGGPDSTALLHALVDQRAALGLGEVVAGHVDHGLRDESAAEAVSVARWCRGLGIRCWTTRVKVEAEGGLQAGARRARYEALETQRAAAGVGWIATGHTATDQAETVLLRLVRGTSVGGLGAIRPVRGRIVRPLLACTREELGAYCQAHALRWLDDPANRSDSFLRARVRHEVIPLLQERLNPAVVSALARLAQSAQQEDEFLSELADDLVRRARRPGGYDAEVLASAHPALRRRALAAAWRAAAASPTDPVDRPHLEALQEAVAAPRGPLRQFTLPGRVTAALERGCLSFRPT